MFRVQIRLVQSRQQHFKVESVPHFKIESALSKQPVTTEKQTCKTLTSFNNFWVLILNALWTKNNKKRKKRKKEKKPDGIRSRQSN